MEQRNQPLKSTTTERGVGGVYAGRKYVGTFWISTATNSVAHRTQQCSVGRQTKGYRRVPVYEENGEIHYIDSEFHNRKTTLCTFCPNLDETDLSWYEEGNCFGTEETAFVDGEDWVIEEYCVTCPVRRECFEYGALLFNENRGSIWGGFKFPREAHQIGAWLERKRRRLNEE